MKPQIAKRSVSACELPKTATWAIGLLLCVATPKARGDVTFTNLHSFDYDYLTNRSGGNGPGARLFQASDGNLYGATTSGGTNNTGIVFRMTPAGAVSTLFSTSTSLGNPADWTGLVEGTDGSLYGTTDTSPGGCVFKLTTAGAFTSLLTFSNLDPPHYGIMTWTGLVRDRSDGVFYGVACSGGLPSIGGDHWGNGFGTVYKTTSDGTFTTLLMFNGTNGSEPLALMQGHDGNFYGTTKSSGTGFMPYTPTNRGTIFKITPSGELTTLASFNLAGTMGDAPFGSLVEDDAGNFYGMARRGGAYNLGTIFKMAPNGDLTLLVSFDGSNGLWPSGGLLRGADGNFYGVTEQGGPYTFTPPHGITISAGTVFKMTPSGTLTTLVFFDGTNGGSPSAGLMQAADRRIYGTTLYGGTKNLGTIFRLSINNLPVVSAPASLSMPMDTATAFSVTATDADGDALVFAFSASHGSVSGTAPNLTYTPEVGYIGLDTILVQVTDAQGGLATASIPVTVTAVGGAVNGTWTNLAGGSWGNSANWLGGIIASWPDASASFSTLNITGNPVVTLDGARTVGSLEFGDATTASHDWTVNAGTGGALSLQVNSGTPTIAVTNRTATITAALKGSQGFKKTGGGTLQLNTSNSLSGGVIVSGGVLIATHADAVKAASSLSVSNGAVFQFGNSFTLNAPATILGYGAGRGALCLAQGGTYTGTLAGNLTLLGTTRIGTYGAFMTLNVNGNIGGTGDLNYWGGGGDVSHVTTHNLAGAMNNVGAIITSEFGCSTRLRTMGANRFSPSNHVTLLSTWNPATFATLDLNTFSQTISNLYLNGAQPKKITDSGAGTPATLTLYTFDWNGGTTYLDHVTLTATSPAGVNSWLDGGSTVIASNGATFNTSYYTDIGSGGDGMLTVMSGAVVRNTGELLLNFPGSGSGTINLAGGTVYSHYLRLGENTSGGTATVNLDAGTLFVNRIYGNDPVQANVFNFNGGTLSPNTNPETGGLNWFNSPNVVALVKNGGAVIDTAGRNVTLANNLPPASGSSGGLIKRGAGVLTLSGTNTYTGPTAVSNGTVLVSGRLQGSQVTVANGTLGGTGTITAPVVVLAGGTLSPGASIGTLTISNTLTLAGTTSVEVNKTTATCDLVRGMTSVTYGGALVVANLGGTLTAGDSFKLFDAGSYLGAFATITPATPGAGLTWDTSSLNVDGRLRVLADTADDDGDGMTNLQEYLAGTDPHNPASRLALESPRVAAGGLSFTLNCIANKSYSILYKDFLSDSTWQKLQDVPAQSTDHVVPVNVPTDAGTGRFFKVVTPQLP